MYMPTEISTGRLLEATRQRSTNCTSKIDAVTLCRASCLPMPNWNNIIQNPHYQNPSLIYNDNPYFICLQTYRRARLLEATRQGSTNSTSKIDAVARILFPASFGLFNIMYWLSYFHPQKPFEWTDHMLKGNFRSLCFRSQILSLDHKKKIFDKWRLPLIFTYLLKRKYYHLRSLPFHLGVSSFRVVFWQTF